MTRAIPLRNLSASSFYCVITPSGKRLCNVCCTHHE